MYSHVKIYKNILEETKHVKRSPYLSLSLPRRCREETWRGRRPQRDPRRSLAELQRSSHTDVSVGAEGRREPCLRPLD